ncbi:MAG: hypothetical protein Kow00121_34540 [Elainellaceae cyanobacterium]
MAENWSEPFMRYYCLASFGKHFHQKGLGTVLIKEKITNPLEKAIAFLRV